MDTESFIKVLENGLSIYSIQQQKEFWQMLSTHIDSKIYEQQNPKPTYEMLEMFGL